MTDTDTLVARLQLSRAHLREVMHKHGAPRSPATATGDHGRIWGWMNQLKTQPAAGVVLDTLGNWWSQHPLRVIGLVAMEAARMTARPIGQRHPFALVAAAFVRGGLFVWTRPWRWILKPALLASLLPQLIRRTIAHTSSRSWLAMLSALTQKPRASSSQTFNDRAASRRPPA